MSDANKKVEPMGPLPSTPRKTEPETVTSGSVPALAPGAADAIDPVGSNITYHP